MINQKVSQEIFNKVNENVQALAKLFPAAVKDGEVDFEALREELGQFQEVGKEKYELTWAGKQNAKRVAHEDILGKTLKFVPEDSKDVDTTENLYIEGDNLEVLKLLRQNYYNSVKMIYIDPPYNTGNDFIYKDNFKISQDEINTLEGNINSVGERLIKNPKNSSRYHTNWLNMLYPRIQIAKDLLKEDGVIFISINDAEVENLISVGKEIFGEDNHIQTLKWKRKKQPSFLHGHVASVVEYIVVFAKNSSELEKLSIETRSDKDTRVDNKSNSISIRKFKKGIRVKLPSEVHVIKAGVYKNKTMETEYLNDVYIENGRTINEFEAKAQFRNEQEGINSFIENDVLFITKNYGFRRDLLEEELGKRKAITDLLLDWGDNQESDNEINKLFPEGKPFDYPKPVNLINNLIKSVNTENEIILDFFSGSGTTAQAVFQLTSSDNIQRKFILVQLQEDLQEAFKNADATSKPTIKKAIEILQGNNKPCLLTEIGKERIRRAGERIKEENKDKEDIENLDIGFKVFQVHDTNIRWTNEAINRKEMTIEESAMSDKDKLDFMPHATDLDVVYEIMLRQRDIPLSSPIEKLSEIGERTYIFKDSYVVCLEENITEELVEKLAAIEPLPIKYVFRDSAFEDNISLKDETFRRLEILIKRNFGESKKTYTVEFL